MGWRNRLITFGGIVIAGLAMVDQLGRKPEDRDWHGSIIGVPYDYRMPTADRLLSRIWNPDDERILVPIVFGVGWTLNLYQVRRRIQLLIA